MIPQTPVQSVLHRSAAMFTRWAVIIAATGFSPLAHISAAQIATSALSEFLAGRIAPEVSEFGEIRMTRQDVVLWTEKARTARQPRDIGIAIANLQNCAWNLLSVPETKPVALELLTQWVLPNVTLLRSLPRTSACSYENVVFGAYACYKQAGDIQGQRRVLDLLSTQARDPGLRDLATLRLAGLKAAEGNFKAAIDVARRTDARGEFAGARTKLVKTWEKELKDRSKRGFH
jgi:hypothetical protein